MRDMHDHQWAEISRAVMKRGGFPPLFLPCKASRKPELILQRTLRARRLRAQCSTASVTKAPLGLPATHADITVGERVIYVLSQTVNPVLLRPTVALMLALQGRRHFR